MHCLKRNTEKQKLEPEVEIRARVLASNIRGPGFISKRTKSKAAESGASQRGRVNICSDPHRKPFLGSATGQLVPPGCGRDLYYRPHIRGGAVRARCEDKGPVNVLEELRPSFINCVKKNWGALTGSTKGFAEPKWAQAVARALCKTTVRKVRTPRKSNAEVISTALWGRDKIQFIWRNTWNSWH